MPESTTSDTTLVPVRFTPQEELIILNLRGKKNWDSRYNEANPAKATVDESDPEGPVSFGAIAQIMSRGRKDPVTGEDIEAAYTQILKDNLVAYDAVVSKKKRAVEIAANKPSELVKWFGGKHRAMSDIHKQKPKGK